MRIVSPTTSSDLRLSANSTDHLLPDLEHSIAQIKAKLPDLLVLEKPSWDNFVYPLVLLEERIEQVWSLVSHFSGVQDNTKIRDIYQQGTQLLIEHQAQIIQNKKIYQHYQLVRDDADFALLTLAQQKVITNILQSFQLEGAQLKKNAQEKLKTIDLQLSQHTNQFEQNVLDSTQNWSWLISDKAQLSGMPERQLKIARQLAKQKKKQGYLLSLQIPSYLSVMQHVDSADVREKVYRAYVTRASELSDEGRFDNTPLVRQILELRQQKAQLLGFDDYAKYSLATKMAKSSQQVVDFLEDILRVAKPKALEEYAQLQQFAQEKYGVKKLAPWDISYYSERLREQLYSIDDATIRSYFPLSKVLSGLFSITTDLFNVRIIENTKEKVWHEDVRCFDVFDEKQQRVGQFFMDIYVREGKRGGAWMSGAIDRHLICDQLQIPVAFLICNFSFAVEGQPVLLTHQEVETLFHEFGHSLHHLLTTVDERDVAGINSVEWDAVELPSQFLENWCWDEVGLEKITTHYQTQTSLPKQLLDRMREAKIFQAGLQYVRQIEFAYFDILVHTRIENCADGDPVQSLLNKVRAQVSVVDTPEYNRFQHSFSHIFAGGYSAGYYSYLWAQVYAADAFAKFEEEGVMNKNVGKRFVDTILSQGGVFSMQLLFENFRSRSANIEALLRSTGLTDSSHACYK